MGFDLPPKTDPEVMIGFSENGGRKWHENDGIHKDKSY